jgi:hypothetical protein
MVQKVGCDNTRNFQSVIILETVFLLFIFLIFFISFLFFKVKEECNIRVIPGTHHVHNCTLTITFRCYVIIAMNLYQPLLKVLSKSLCLL